ncbi:VOC family protein [Nocardiopsis prasina]|uniref:VOC family protein n=1 Tax=Nocardiopsis prasina TaxID=2015 RepID=UPI00034DE662|nr:VOC family protein [Nocardiopsis prasina]
MALSLDTVTVEASRAEDARAFHASVFTPGAPADSPVVDLNGTGRLSFEGTDSIATGFRGCVLSVIVERPAEVQALVETAAAHGAEVVKPPRKELFGEYTAVFRTPDGTLWKLAAATKKNRGAVPEPPEPVETAVYLGVTSPKASQGFYGALGMETRHDYGDKFVDFTAVTGTSRLGLLRRAALAKDVGVDEHGTGPTGVVLTHTAASRADLDALLSRADAAAAAVTVPEPGTHTGGFTDPDGHRWRITAMV